MILTPHAIIGAAIAQSFHSPILGFLAAFASHFALDAIPHWHYKIFSRKVDHKNPLNNRVSFGREMIIDALRVSFDGIMGLGLAIYILQPAHAPWEWNIIIGALGGMLPDVLQVAYWLIRREPLVSLQRFHIWCHAKLRLDDKKALGITLDVVIVAAVILVTRFLSS